MIIEKMLYCEEKTISQVKKNEKLRPKKWNHLANK